MKNKLDTDNLPEFVRKKIEELFMSGMPEGTTEKTKHIMTQICYEMYCLGWDSALDIAGKGLEQQKNMLK